MQLERIGGTRTFAVDLRSTAAAIVSLEQAVAEGSLRTGLYQRRNALAITM